MLKFTCEKRAKNGRARAGTIETDHGKIETPAFIPVATKATIKSLTPELVRDEVKPEAVLANTYHLYLQPGTEILEKAGGLGKFMNWQKPTFTDSGGFQAFSLSSPERRAAKIAKNSGENNSVLDSGSAPKEIGDPNERSGEPPFSMAKVNDDGVTFKSIIDGSTHIFTPERSIDIQHKIGADIIFAFDECILPGESYERQKQAVARTTDWAKRCLDHHNDLNSKKNLSVDTKQIKPALFGIVQGGRHEELRKQSAKEIGNMGFDGFGIGGSFDKDDIGTAVGWVTDELPFDKPRHLLGIGSEPSDLILGIENGIDTFDCVAPARIARTGTAYVYSRSHLDHWKINLMNAQYRDDFGPIDDSCKCYTCKNYTKAYISHLFRAKEMLAATLVTIHNLYFVVDLTRRARQAIIEDRFIEFKKEVLGK